ncbi:DUF5683 domain-containing protein [uncultured Bacteroides sp.]|uniref:DUF5683 domain-containing protein n=1 Tax=uncultured Bacteroides sp. TaxID=162156 RepID=UPI0025F1324B|nr:DUF5683 domain-containing protein [uncultured Bacteroides sp.]
MMKSYLYRKKMRYALLLLWIALGALAPFRVCAQKVLQRSEKMRPAWLANRLPKPGNSTFHYQVTEGEHRNLEEARHSCLLNLSTYIKRTHRIEEQTVADIKLEQQNGAMNESENYRFAYNIEGQQVIVTSHKYDEYWEYLLYPNGERIYRCYTLYGVADTPNVAFDRLSFSRKYGVRGAARSLIVPGWGQLYKGNTAKGASILGGEIALAAGILVAENQRSSYVKKMREQPKHLATYNTKADNWENIRNACIGGAAALYVYNLVDALVANGRKRSIRQKGSPVHMALYPSVGSCNGVTLAFRFQ